MQERYLAMYQLTIMCTIHWGEKDDVGVGLLLLVK